MAGEPIRKSAIRLLLIDDERVFLEVLAKRLKLRGILPTMAFSGKEGIQLLRGHSFDVVVLDLKMVDMDGLEVLKIIKIIDPQLPVIMLTGHGSEDATSDGMAGGAYDYLTKPYDLDLLVEKIRQAAAAGRRPDQR